MTKEKIGGGGLESGGWESISQSPSPRDLPPLSLNTNKLGRFFEREGGRRGLMFHSSYQDGDCVEVFSPAGKNPGSEWKLSGKVDRLYEKGVKG